MADLDREDMMEAVAEGVRQAFSDALATGGSDVLPRDLLHDAIRRGVADAVWRVATNATDAPCADFYDSIKDGASYGYAPPWNRTLWYGGPGAVLDSSGIIQQAHLVA